MSESLRDRVARVLALADGRTDPEVGPYYRQADALIAASLDVTFDDWASVFEEANNVARNYIVTFDADKFLS